MSGTASTAVGRHLGSLILQTLFVVPFAVGQMTIEEWPHEGVLLRLLDLALAVAIGYFVVRNLRRLWLAPTTEASRTTSMLQLVVSALLLLMSTGPLLESHTYSTKPTGIALLLVGTALAFLGLRDAVRIRVHRRVMTGR